MERAAELGRIEREAAELDRSILDLSGDLAAAKRERDAQVGRQSAERTRAEALEQWKQQRAVQERVTSVERASGKSLHGPDDLTR